ncbi:large ribosomal subunit protein mL64 [Brachyhypopomus gauderio]|uniref:large ribosomal subunit protein mL64 n=1 Tax=Brachyhypopomus gauderio TaxID=698409 RepID=UPI0040418B9A
MAASLLGSRTATLTSLSNFKSFLPVISQSFILQQTAGYNPKPLRLNLKDPYIPDKTSEKTPEWQKTEKFDRRLFGRYGRASGVDPVQLWPSPAQLQELIAEEQEWYPPPEELLQKIEAKENERAAKRLAREKLIAANMAKMPKMIADWRNQRQEAKRKAKEEKAKKERLLAVARERFGQAIDPRSQKFQDMVAEMEKEEKRKRKLLKRQKREEELGLAP